MVDNLRYGGTTTSGGSTDYCATKTSMPTYGDGTGTVNTGWYGKTGSNATGTGTTTQIYGDCRNPTIGGSSPCTSGTTVCGYSYNWQAAIQAVNANYGVAYTPPSYPVQGICPVGWHLPTGGSSTGEYYNLYVAVGGTGTSVTSGPAFTFFSPGGNWKGLYSGYSIDNGSLDNQGTYGYFWSSVPSSATLAYYEYFYSGYVYSGNNASNKLSGFAVRCLKN
jgi:uncharacterized protein (TIGR02145 family)